MLLISYLFRLFFKFISHFLYYYIIPFILLYYLKKKVFSFSSLSSPFLFLISSHSFLSFRLYSFPFSIIFLSPFQFSFYTFVSLFLFLLYFTCLSFFSCSLVFEHNCFYHFLCPSRPCCRKRNISVSDYILFYVITF